MVGEYQQLVKSMKIEDFRLEKRLWKGITLSCRNVQSIFISRKARRAATTDWKTLGIFFNATRRLVRGSVTALNIHLSNKIIFKLELTYHITPNAP